ncbi:hypothetical protein J6590_033877 [Homalodisca vitripennis]|nr:hypothetical protein J6590_033877 [Homalodisca vitripennis]
MLSLAPVHLPLRALFEICHYPKKDDVQNGTFYLNENQRRRDYQRTLAFPEPTQCNIGEEHLSIWCMIRVDLLTWTLQI